ncbi:MAG: GrpB family protein [Planctomycetia bacterium]|jgi:GrpB-like predicted nucleotidyltransferase (UPF0157 family)
MESLEEKIKRVTAEQVDLEPYNPDWPKWFEEEKAVLLSRLPEGLVVRIEHFGSTAVMGLTAKPIVDLLVEVNDVSLVKKIAPKIFPPPQYDYFWRPSWGDDIPPWYSFLIRRNSSGKRTHHIHIGEPDFKNDELHFRDILRNRPDLAEEYGELKTYLAKKHHDDRIAYTEAKGEFVRRVLGE